MTKITAYCLGIWFSRVMLFLACLGTASFTSAQDASTVSVNGEIVSIACSLNTADISVDMGSVSASDIAAVGVGSPIARFSTGNLVLNCNQGATLSVVFQDASSPNSTLPYLSLTPGGVTAKGVGIQVYRGDDTVIPLGPNASWVAGTNVPAGAFTIPVRARYYRTASTVTAGAANAKALFTVTYQ